MTMTLKEVAENMRLFAESGSDPLPETIDKWLDSIDIHLLSQPQPVAQVEEDKINGEAVAQITRNGDDFNVSWLIEGGIDAMIEGETLYILGMKCPDDGGIELYTNQATASANPAQVEAVAWRWRSPAMVEFNRPWELTSNVEFVELLNKDASHVVEPLYATPTIPTGYRLVPVERMTLREYGIDELAEFAISATKWMETVYRDSDYKLMAPPSVESVSNIAKEEYEELYESYDDARKQIEDLKAESSRYRSALEEISDHSVSTGRQNQRLIARLLLEKP